METASAVAVTSLAFSAICRQDWLTCCMVALVS